MAVYPDIITGVPIVIPYEASIEQRVLVSEFESGAEQRRIIDHAPRKTISLRYEALTHSEFAIIKVFYEQMKGSWESFSFNEPDTNTITVRFDSPIEWTREGPYYSMKVRLKEVLSA